MTIRVATAADTHYADLLCQWYIESAKQRGTGIAKRDPEYVREKMRQGNSVLAFVEGELAGFCYIETFESGKFVANSGLVVNVELRKHGLGRAIKREIFRLSRTKYPEAKIFGITTSLAVMKINSDLGYKPVTFSELTTSEDFWKGCKSCKNFGILTENERKMCLCTGMVFDDIHAPLPETEDNENTSGIAEICGCLLWQLHQCNTKLQLGAPFALRGSSPRSKN